MQRKHEKNPEMEFEKNENPVIPMEYENRKYKEMSDGQWDSIFGNKGGRAYQWEVCRGKVKGNR